VHSRGGRIFAPKLIDELIGRDDLVRVQDEDRQQRALAKPAEGHSLATVETDLKGPENPELNHSPHSANGNTPAAQISIDAAHWQPAITECRRPR
jgi:hypothetical protein